MSDDSGNQNRAVTSVPPTAPAGSPGSEAVWADLDRAYHAEHQHAKRISDLNNANNTNNALTFQSGMLAILLGGEEEVGLTETLDEGQAAQQAHPPTGGPPDPESAGAGVPPANPTQPREAS